MNNNLDYFTFVARRPECDKHAPDQEIEIRLEEVLRLTFTPKLGIDHWAQFKVELCDPITLSFKAVYGMSKEAFCALIELLKGRHDLRYKSEYFD